MHADDGDAECRDGRVVGGSLREHLGDFVKPALVTTNREELGTPVGERVGVIDPGADLQCGVVGCLGGGEITGQAEPTRTKELQHPRVERQAGLVDQYLHLVDPAVDLGEVAGLHARMHTVLAGPKALARVAQAVGHRDGFCGFGESLGQRLGLPPCEVATSDDVQGSGLRGQTRGEVDGFEAMSRRNSHSRASVTSASPASSSARDVGSEALTASSAACRTRICSSWPTAMCTKPSVPASAAATRRSLSPNA